MSEIKRLLDEPVSARAARMLRSADGDGPASSEDAKVRTLAALGALPPAATVASAATKARPVISLVHVLGAGGALAVLSIVVGFTAFGSHATGGGDVPGAPREAITAPSNQAPPSLPAAGSMRVEDLPTAPGNAPPNVTPNRSGNGSGNARDERAPSSSSAHRPSTAAAPSRLEDELAAIDAAREAIASGRPDAALTQVSEYHRQFRSGRFAEEADALEIQALAGVGRLAEARTKGEQFLASHPGSPYERRVRSSIATTEGRP